MEHIVTRDDILARVPKAHNDGINWHALAFVDKYSPDQTRHAEEKLLRLRPQVLAHKGRPVPLSGVGGHSLYNGALREALEVYTGEPEDGTAEAASNLLTTEGLTCISALLIGVGGSGRLFNLSTTQAVCGVGATATTATIADTQLGADAGSAWYQAMDSANPTRAAGVLTGITTYASADGNFAWNEWGWFSGGGTRTAAATIGHAGTNVYGTTSSSAMWNHKIASLGTKVSGASWVFTATITLS